MQYRPKSLLMVGAAIECPGGISAVVKCYRDHGLFGRWRVRYVSTFEAPNLVTQLAVMSKALWVISWMLLRREVALMHAHSASRGSFWRKSVCCALSRIYGVPYIFHIHSGEFLHFYNDECGPLAKFWVRLTLRKAAQVVVLSDSWLREIRTIVPTATIKVIGNPVSVATEFPSRTAHTGRVLFLGRLREKKGVFDLIRAIPIVRRTMPTSVFVLAGDGDVEAVRKFAQSHAVSDAIEIPGWIDGEQKESAIRAAELLVLPSYFEGLPVCVLEAMANGAVVVATRVGGIPDVITSGVTGMLLEPGDIRGLADVIVRLLTDDDLSIRLRLAAYEDVKQKFCARAIVDKLHRCYAENSR
jgi:glycosyltransferase involved in cell wall biosynthesis